MSNNRINFPDKEFTQKVGLEVLLKMEENPGMTLREATGVSDETLEEIYSLAYGFYNQGRYEESIALFQLLAGCAPTHYKYVLGLASSYHQINAYEEAAAGFLLALQLEVTNPIPAYYAADSFLKREMQEEADEMAKMTIDICGTRPEYSELKERCQLIVKSLKIKK